MTEPIRRLATVTGYPSLIEALRARVEELQIAHKDVDALARCAEGYTSKVLGPSQVKMIGMQNLWPLMWALGLRFAVENDPEALALMEQEYERRQEKFRRPGNGARAFGAGTLHRFAREMGRRGGAKAKQFALTREQRAKIGRENVKKRKWRPVRRRRA